MDTVPDDKFKGYYTKNARFVFDTMLAHPKKEGGYFEEKDERQLMGVYNAMAGLIRQGKYDFIISLDTKEHKIWIKKSTPPPVKQ